MHRRPLERLSTSWAHTCLSASSKDGASTRRPKAWVSYKEERRSASVKSDLEPGTQEQLLHFRNAFGNDFCACATETACSHGGDPWSKSPQKPPVGLGRILPRLLWRSMVNGRVAEACRYAASLLWHGSHRRQQRVEPGACTTRDFTSSRNHFRNSPI